MCNFACLDPITKTKLFKSFCCSHYGCELRDRSCRKLDDYCDAWKKELRILWDLPLDFRSDDLPFISGCTPIYDEVCRRTMNFMVDCSNSEIQTLYRFLVKHAAFCARSASFWAEMCMAICSVRFNLSFSHLLKRKRNLYFYDDWASSILSANEKFLLREFCHFA